ncbi:hypothetical protein GCM10007425_23590 [Lysinibacillus alkalisoli]|uniref:Competence protein n=1 Tax=Lysinibacillus alkalisoli TaxID=1911548 RepID=A0A917LIV6_9BACI|nr:competence protein ComK [Lysinibacillus alkalisoli]GGG28192.1 hypothetical protein GCM10007425_23590 [Lysinibacillus alkalisoli]
MLVWYKNDIASPMVTKEILLIEPCMHSNYLARIITKNDKFYTTHSPVTIIDKMCLANGSSLAGRLSGSRHILGVKRLPPLFIGGTPVFAIQLKMSQEKTLYLFTLDFKTYPAAEKGSYLELDDNGYRVYVKASLATIARKCLEVGYLMLKL